MIHVLTRSELADGLRACLGAVDRAIDDDLGYDIVDDLHRAYGLFAEVPFRALGPDRLPADAPAVIALRDALEELAAIPRLHAHLVGHVRTRPRMLNPIQPRWHACDVPVVLEGRIIGRTLRERYPVVMGTEAEFEVELDASAVPATWQGATVAFERVDQGSTWPGPPPLRIHLTCDAVVLVRQLRSGRSGNPADSEE